MFAFCPHVPFCPILDSPALLAPNSLFSGGKWMDFGWVFERLNRRPVGETPTGATETVALPPQMFTFGLLKG